MTFNPWLLLEAGVALLDVVSAILLILTALELLRLERLLSSPRDPALAFALLGLGQLAGAGALHIDGRAGFALYLGSALLPAAGITLLSLSAKPSRQLFAVPALYVVLAADLAGAASMVAASSKLRGRARSLALVSGLGYALRFAGLPLLPAATGGLLLALGETVRALSFTGLAVSYRPIGGEG